MRTPEQIKNLRTVLAISILGPYATFMSDELINAWADRIQKEIDNAKCSWEVRIRISENSQSLWADIEKEPALPVGSLKEMSRVSNELLDKYPVIDAIQIIDSRTHLNMHLFERTKGH